MHPARQLDERLVFPHPDTALRRPDGFLAAGGDLEPARLKIAYQSGIFPYYSQDPPEGTILWWSPARRAVIFPAKLHLSRSLKRRLRKQDFSVTLDQAFNQVIHRCARREETWITPRMCLAYNRLHEAGVAHSLEVWQDNLLIGGLYGVATGRIFFAESMFSARTNGSKIALAYLAAQLQHWGFVLIDCQMQNSHLARMGAVLISRKRLLDYLEKYASQSSCPAPWVLDCPSFSWQS